MQDEINIREFIKIFTKYWYLVLLIPVLSALFVGWPAVVEKPVYEAKAYLLLKGSNMTGNQLAGLVGINAGSSNNSFLSIIKSRAVAELVLNDLKLRERIAGWGNPAISTQELVSFVQKMPDFRMGDLFEINVTNKDRLLVADAANAYARAGEEYWRKMNYTETRKKKEYIEKQMPRITMELKAAEGKLKKYTVISPNEFAPSGLEFNKLKREYDILNETYVLLRKEYESVKLDESKETDPFTMIDYAEPPLNPVGKKFFLKFVIGFVFGLIGSTFLAFFVDYWGKTKQLER